MKRVIFLDLDGVMNSYEFDNAIVWSTMPPERNADLSRNAEYLARCLDPLAMQRFGRVLAAIPDIEIILTTTWRHAIGFYNIRNTFALHGVSLDIKGEISRAYFGEGRNFGIMEWIIQNDPLLENKFVVLDDMPLDFSRDACSVADRLLGRAGNKESLSEVFQRTFIKTDPQYGLQDHQVERIIKILA